LADEPAQLSLIDILNWIDIPLTQDDHFKASHLETLFRTKIAKSQATGKDGVRIGRFEEALAAETALIERKIKARTYAFTTFKERLILRGAARPPRQISIPTVRDRLVLRAVCQVLHTFKPETIGSSPHALVAGVVKTIRSGDYSNKSFVRVDVRDFFPSLSHAILERELLRAGFSDMVRLLCMNAVRTATGDTDGTPVKGVPQGLSISGALAALYMLRFDQKRRRDPFTFFRYVDDILIICDTKSAEDNLKLVDRALRSRGLIIHKKGVAGKTEISAVADGIDFLGYRICPKKVAVRSSSFRRMFKNILKVITDFRYRRDTSRTLFRLNLKITGCVVDAKRRGWMMFFSQTEDLNQLAHLDAFVVRQLRRVGFPNNQSSEVKRFVKSYHEIRYSLDSTDYIPNFDIFTDEQKAEAVAALSGRELSAVLAMDHLAIDAEFSRLVSREVHDLEQDVGSPS
jgi:RNA-directed DNA polymerase